MNLHNPLRVNTFQQCSDIFTNENKCKLACFISSKKIKKKKKKKKFFRWYHLVPRSTTVGTTVGTKWYHVVPRGTTVTCKGIPLYSPFYPHYLFFSLNNLFMTGVPKRGSAEPQGSVAPFLGFRRKIKKTKIILSQKNEVKKYFFYSILDKKLTFGCVEEQRIDCYRAFKFIICEFV